MATTTTTTWPSHHPIATRKPTRLTSFLLVEGPSPIPWDEDDGDRPASRLRPFESPLQGERLGVLVLVVVVMSPLRWRWKQPQCRRGTFFVPKHTRGAVLNRWIRRLRDNQRLENKAVLKCTRTIHQCVCVCFLRPILYRMLLGCLCVWSMGPILLLVVASREWYRVYRRRR